jgi:hypothetical protein
MQEVAFQIKLQLEGPTLGINERTNLMMTISEALERQRENVGFGCQHHVVNAFTCQAMEQMQAPISAVMLEPQRVMLVKPISLEEYSENRCCQSFEYELQALIDWLRLEHSWVRKLEIHCKTRNEIDDENQRYTSYTARTNIITEDDFEEIAKLIEDPEVEVEEFIEGLENEIDEYLNGDGLSAESAEMIEALEESTITIRVNENRNLLSEMKLYTEILPTT